MSPGTRLCAQCLLRWVFHNPGTQTPIFDKKLTFSLQIPGGRMAELYSGKIFFLIKNIGLAEDESARKMGFLSGRPHECGRHSTQSNLCRHQPLVSFPLFKTTSSPFFRLVNF